MRKRVLILAVAMLALLILVAAWAKRDDLGLVRGPFIDRKHYNCIREGMSEAQVEAILGAPPYAYSRKMREPYWWHEPRFEEPAPEPRVSVRDNERVVCWFGKGSSIQITFDAKADRVLHARFEESAPPPSVAERVRDWLRRLWP
jgi:hypothetical protein